jgi:hypothetical protein
MRFLPGGASGPAGAKMSLVLPVGAFPSGPEVLHRDTVPRRGPGKRSLGSAAI